MYSCWPLISSSNADMLSRLSDRLGKLVCGLAPPSTTTTPSDGDPPRACGGLSSPLLFSPGSREGLRGCLPSSSSRPAEDDDAAVRRDADEEDDDGDEAALLPCLAFGSEEGYRVFSLAENRMLEDGAEVGMRLVRGRRLVPSPFGGKVFTTDMCGLLASHLADPFTGARTPLPGLPIPLCQEEPMPVEDEDEPRPSSSRGAPRLMNTDDAFAWDLSPQGPMVARGDTVFFFPASGGQNWVPVHRSRCGSAMTVNYRAGCFFILELDSLITTVIDAGTLAVSAVIDPPPHRSGIFHAILVTSAAADVLLLTLRRGRYDDRIQVYRAQHRQQPSSGGGINAPPAPIRWEPVKDIGDRAVFVDTRHGFTVRAGERARRNCVYMVMRHEELDDEDEDQESTGRHGGNVVARHVIKVAPLGELIRGWELDKGSDQLGRFKVKRPTAWGRAHWIIPDRRISSTS